MGTMEASFTRWIPSIDENDLFTLLLGNPLYDLQKLPKCQIGNFSSPQTLHSFETQRLETQHIKLIG